MMRIKAEKWEFDETASYKIRELHKCCDEIMRSKNIELIHEYDNEDDSDYSFKLTNSYYDDQFGDYYEYEHIKYCPFCGAYIKIDIEEVIDKSDEFDKLIALERELALKARDTDSRRQYDRLKDELREIRNKIGEYYTSDNKLKFEGER